ncbi:hypothetical protein [Legionella maioricensis]|uniref:Uncharacterized protein n=1 Tax=Legionella maioricensis TaxID=2896528 RepID=A0A9X2IAV6_9GAMM|nr:hypothetical protein [Legionella maioricensis]MCL9684349.1 hypothetical protein [Legionella maioricensis]MCL9688777.1 hypothetical protein [Legionella maioricensis]
MKKILLMGLTAATLSFTPVSQADITVHSNTPDACEYIAGHWAGTGKASNWVIGECIYHGAGTVSTVDNTGSFKIEVTSNKDSGSLLCPAHAKKRLTGTCINGVVTIKTEYGDLAGHFSQNSGDAKGTLSVARGISADVVIQFQRVE